MDIGLGISLSALLVTPNKIFILEFILKKEKIKNLIQLNRPSREVKAQSFLEPDTIVPQKIFVSKFIRVCLFAL